MNNPYISDLKLPTNYIEKVIADIDNDVYSDSIVKLDVNSIKIGDRNSVRPTCHN